LRGDSDETPAHAQSESWPRSREPAFTVRVKTNRFTSKTLADLRSQSPSPEQTISRLPMFFAGMKSFPCATSFYEAQKSIVTILLRDARLAVDCQLAVLKPGTVIASGGRGATGETAKNVSLL
jgi:hypothetical protein